ncbi:universal stress protein [Methanoplanus limicola]|uniref:UspA domain-containing protein n=1 Tax=Methanoplanus limicola DSM 2279 TaxID=937775 RepID=H1Z0S1_9EURY|nr:universal stress protein [Methanoplanus limicola]EHQ36214.1 UspA domain-containing protein [Methanoplanus limicola DSM 2279]
MYKKILLASDGSDNAERAAKEAAGLAEELSSQIILTYITGTPPQSKLVKDNFDVHKVLKDDAEKKIKQTISALTEKEIPYTLKVAIGDPADEIIRIAEKEKADLIILGSRGLGTIKGVVLGSVSRKVTHSAECPVMIIK